MYGRSTLMSNKPPLKYRQNKKQQQHIKPTTIQITLYTVKILTNKGRSSYVVDLRWTF